MKTCEGCRMLMLKDPLKRGDCWTLHCTDPDKPIHGKCRTIAVGWIGPPIPPPRPAWCRGKKKTARRAGTPTDGKGKEKQ